MTTTSSTFPALMSLLLVACSGGVAEDRASFGATGDSIDPPDASSSSSSSSTPDEGTGSAGDESTSTGSEGATTTGLSGTSGDASETGSSSGGDTTTGGGELDNTSVCLSRPQDMIEVMDGAFDDELEYGLPEPGLALDVRDGRFEYDFVDEQGAMAIDGAVAGACILGVTVIGTQDPLLDWAVVKNTDAVRFIHRPDTEPGDMVAEGIWVENVGDAFEPARYSGAAGQGYTWTLQHSYFRHIRDDVIENDACHSGQVKDVLVDDSFVFLSSRPGSGNDLDTGDEAPIIEVEGSLIHTASTSLGGRPWKWPGSSSSCTPTPLLHVRDTVLRMDQAGGNLTFPEGEYENVTVVWLGGGEYPEPLPAGVTVTDDLEVWNDARDAWIEAHGCDDAMTHCTNLVSAP